MQKTDKYRTLRDAKSVLLPKRGGIDMKDLTRELTERFYRYIAVPSQSSSNGGTLVPSTPEQWDMAKLLQKECEEIGLVDLYLSDKCVLTGRLPAHLPAGE